MAQHNTYSNFATFTVANAISHTESLDAFFGDGIKEIKEKYSDHDTRLISAAGLLKNCVESMAPRANNPIWGPLINAQISQYINFRELAEEMLESY